MWDRGINEPIPKLFSQNDDTIFSFRSYCVHIVSVDNHFDKQLVPGVQKLIFLEFREIDFLLVNGSRIDDLLEILLKIKI